MVRSREVSGPIQMIPRSFSIESSIAGEECGVHINYPSLSHFLRWAGITAGSGKKQRAPLPGGPSVHHTAACIITQRAGPHPPPAAATLSIQISFADISYVYRLPLLNTIFAGSLDSCWTVGGGTTLPACPPPYLLSDKLLP